MQSESSSITPVERVVFISSTKYDLHEEIATVDAFLRGWRSAIYFKTLLSERPDFPLNPHGIAQKHSYQLCLDVLARAEYVVLMIKKRYGAPIISHRRRRISITHLEYREAFRLELPVLTLVHRTTWDAWHEYKQTGHQSAIAPKQIGVFDLLVEITRGQKGRRKRNNWVCIYDNLDDVETFLRTTLCEFDDTEFLGDITYPAVSFVKTGQSFVKVWEARNSGAIIWENRFLREENPSASGLMPEAPLVPIPRTMPGQTIQMAIRFRAPKFPGTYCSYWKAVDSAGKVLFPDKGPLRCEVKVVTKMPHIEPRG